MTAIQNLNEIRCIGYDVESIRIPVSSTYKLSFANLSYFDAIIVKLHTSTGETLTGEVVPLPGYLDETLGNTIEICKSWAPYIVNKCYYEIQLWLGKKVSSHPIAASLFLSALDNLHASVRRWPTQFTQPVPLVFAVSAVDGESAHENIDAALSEGYRTIKVKVGGKIECDTKFLSYLLHNKFPKKTKFRFDANQGWSLAQAKQFFQIAETVPEGIIEHIEQPLEVSDWDGAACLCQKYQVPLMLDESIRTLLDITRSAQIGCTSIKLKLCKQGGVSQVLRAAKHARAYGLGTIFGNGVATDISNLLELRLFDRHRHLFQGASESTGFAKILSPQQKSFPMIEAGFAVWNSVNNGTSTSN